MVSAAFFSFLLNNQSLVTKETYFWVALMRSIPNSELFRKTPPSRGTTHIWDKMIGETILRNKNPIQTISFEALPRSEDTVLRPFQTT
jgi:hypothetical protein